MGGRHAFTCMPTHPVRHRDPKPIPTRVGSTHKGRTGRQGAPRDAPELIHTTKERKPDHSPSPTTARAHPTRKGSDMPDVPYLFSSPRFRGQWPGASDQEGERQTPE